MDETVVLNAIRKDLRLAMDGVVSTSMRQKGMEYKLNFGVGIPRLREIAKKYEADKSLAEMLWKQNVRELRILATLLYPLSEFTQETADEWIGRCSNQELREQLCMNLLQNTEFAHILINNCAQSEEAEMRLTAYVLFIRVLIVKSRSLTQVELYRLLGVAVSDLRSSSVAQRHGALNALKFAGRIGEDVAGDILRKISSFRTSDDSVEKEIYAALAFEFSAD